VYFLRFFKPIASTIFKIARKTPYNYFIFKHKIYFNITYSNLFVDRYRNFITISINILTKVNSTSQIYNKLFGELFIEDIY